MEKNNKKNICEISLEELNKKYKKSFFKLAKIKNSEINDIDKVINVNGKSILGKGDWWYVKENNTYYQKPRLFSLTWFKTLHIAVKTSICVLLASGITCATVLPIYLNKNKNKYSFYSVACIGDSITWGYTPYTGAQLDEPYPVALKNAIGFGYAFNYGIPCSTLCNDYSASETHISKAYAPMVERIETITRSVNLIIVWGGINDYNRGCDLGKQGDTDTKNVYGALHSIAEFLKTNFNNSFVMFVTPLPAKYDGIMYYVDNIKQAITYTGKQYNYPVLDLTRNSGFEEEINAGLNDGVHPSQNFVKNKLVPKIVSFIKSHL